MRVPTRADLSREQRDIFLNAPLNKIVFITGPPGTGKTVIAIYRAWLLEQQEHDYTMVMHSSVLEHYTGIGMSHSGVEGHSATWHSWIWHWWKKAAGKKPPQVQKYVFDYQEMIRQLVSGEIQMPERLDWGHLILDEGQDFPAEFYTVCRIIIDMYGAKEEESHAISVFADENQRLNEDNTSVAQIQKNLKPHFEYNLTENFRSTYEIAKLSSEFYVGLGTGIPQLPEGNHGRKPVLKRCNSLSDEVEYILRYARNNDDQTVGVIVANIQTQKTVVKELKAKADNKQFNIQKYNHWDRKHVKKLEFAKGGTIMVLCDASCKGLEFDAVFIPQLQTFAYEGADDEFFKMKMYVMTSRARSFLALIYSNCDQDPAILDLLPAKADGILDWK